MIIHGGMRWVAVLANAMVVGGAGFLGQKGGVILLCNGKGKRWWWVQAS